MRILSIIIGLIALTLGVIPLLHTWEIISFNLPYSPANLILSALLIISAILLFVDAWDMMSEGMKHITIILALLFIVLGAYPILTTLNIINLGFMDSILGMIYFKSIIFILGGFFMLYGGFTTGI